MFDYHIDELGRVSKGLGLNGLFQHTRYHEVCRLDKLLNDVSRMITDK